jgi:hypothetical protein
VPPDEIVDLLLRNSVEVLELVHGRELGNVETVRRNTVRLPLEEVLRLVRRDVRNRREDIGAVRRAPFDAVPVVDPPLARFVVDVEEGEVVVEVDRTGAEVTTEEGRVGGEDGGNVDVALPAERNTETRLPLMEVGDDGLGPLASRELRWKKSVNLSREKEEKGTENAPLPRTKPSSNPTESSRSSPCRWAG